MKDQSSQNHDIFITFSPRLCVHSDLGAVLQNIKNFKIVAETEKRNFRNQRKLKNENEYFVGILSRINLKWDKWH